MPVRIWAVGVVAGCVDSYLEDSAGHLPPRSGGAAEAVERPPGSTAPRPLLFQCCRSPSAGRPDRTVQPVDDRAEHHVLALVLGCLRRTEQARSGNPARA